MLHSLHNGERYALDSPTAMPKAAGFLWNRRMMLQMTCRGYAVAQFMQPEPAKYAYAPNLEAKTFMQPEQPYYAHHPGRFFYVKDEESGALFSAPYEPVRATPDRFRFTVGKADLEWTVECHGITVELAVSLAPDDVAELWKVKLTNTSGRPRKLSLYPYFPVGYMSWMNQGGKYRPDLGGIVCSAITPYQKLEDYFKNKQNKDKTFLLADREPDAWEARQEAFEGEGGLHAPSGILQERLECGEALYETPTAALQYRMGLETEESREFRFVFGATLDDDEIRTLRDRYLGDKAFARARASYADYMAQGTGCIRINTPDKVLDEFVNHWLPRQVFYHADVNRLSTDPQTRNYLQDNMGISYINPKTARAAFLHALAQQEKNGAMPDGVLVAEGAELKYINQIPHTDQCVWLPICLQAYLDETNDIGLLKEEVVAEDGKSRTVFDRIMDAMQWILRQRDWRGLSYIGQGDWCDPMNMVGHKGKGVSGWLSLATAYALKVWADICDRRGRIELGAACREQANAINRAVNTWLWDGNWFGRGITDDGKIFGVSSDSEGRIYLNPQSWAILSGAASAHQREAMLKAVDEQLATPYGLMLLAPSYTGMREDIGRVTQKFPGVAENGAIYNHATAFYIFSLYTVGEADRAYQALRQMIPGPNEEDYLRRGQMPVFIPNYYRGDYHQFPQTAGRSSGLFNTGTVAWVYRSLIEGMFGLKGDGMGLAIRPNLPSQWKTAEATRIFRGATFEVSIQRERGLVAQRIHVDGSLLAGDRVNDIEPGRTYRVEVTLPLQ